MSPAIAAPPAREAVRLLVLDALRAAPVEAPMAALPDFLRAGDLLVVNDAATLPASLHGRTARAEPIELRLLGPIDGDRARAVLFGRGDFHEKTEQRAPPPEVVESDVLELPGLRATVTARAALSPRLLELRFDRGGGELLAALYRAGQPIQYSHHPAQLPLYEFQTAYGARPWAVEMPSAGRPLSFGVLHALRERGVRVAALTHAAGLSATGDAAIDAALPLPERYEIPETTAQRVAEARARDARVIAVGTSVVRALEASAAVHGAVRGGGAETDLLIGPDSILRAVDGLLTGIHQPGESHHRLLHAFVPPERLERALHHAAATGYRTHEFGDAMLIVG